MINNPALPANLRNINGIVFTGKLFPALIALGFVIGAVVFMFTLIIGAIQWITSGGDKMRLEQARGKVTSAVIGLIVLFSFFAIINFVECFIGFGFRQIRIGPFDIGFMASNLCQSSGTGSDSGPGQPVPTSPNPGTCTPSCNWGFCSTGGGVSECCSCVIGNDASGYGPVTCCTPPGPSSGSCRTYNVNGCRAGP